jgi:phosphopantothenoylcysteine decarboxylase/phosphopantothenate--cysteine ligase
MLEACNAALPVDVAVCVAAVADWRPADTQSQKIKKRAGDPAPTLVMVENPDILKTLSKPGPKRPDLVIGFAAETEDLSANARRKLEVKGCDWIIANNVSAEQHTFGSVNNTVQVFDGDGDPETWPSMTKKAVAERLALKIAEHVKGGKAAGTTD